MRRTGLVLLVSILLFPVPTYADGLFDENWYIAAMLSHIDDDDDRDTDDGISGYQFSLGMDLNASSSIEFNTVATYFNADGANADQQQWGFGVDYVRTFFNQQYFVPYAVVGGGFIKTQNKNPSRKDSGGATTSLALGILTPVKLFDMSLRTEVRLRTDYSVDVHQDYLLTIGLQRAMKSKPTVFSDRDGDGVADPQDRCGSTPRNSIVDRYGCARSHDRDGDGVADDKDMCGDTPPGLEVDAAGCMRSDDPER